MQLKVKKIECTAIVEVINEEGLVVGENPVSLTVFEVGFNNPISSLAATAENFVINKLQSDLTKKEE